VSAIATRVLDEGPDDEIVICRSQDVGPALERAKALHNAGSHWSKDREYAHAMSIPEVLVEDYCNKHGITLREWLNDEQHIARMLSDPDLSNLRIWKGRC
jgi:hypothetical protein